MDLMLDLVVELDGSWRWKDRREFDAVVERGLLDRSTVDRVLTEADGVIERIEANAAPFNEDWHRWRPPAHWETPRLPSGWERVPARA
jgi:hypothetical protein